MSRYADRRHAGRALGHVLDSFRERPEVVVLALPRGGVPVAYEVAAALQAPLDIFVARKIGLPSRPELALGAVASGGVQVLNDELIERLHLSRRMVDAIAEVERREVERRERAYRGGRPPVELYGRTAILVDDGLATGASMRAAVRGLRRLGPARIVVAVPVAAPDSCRELATEADDVVCASTPEPFRFVGQWYEDFTQTSDEEVRELLALAADERAQQGASAH